MNDLLLVNDLCKVVGEKVLPLVVKEAVTVVEVKGKCLLQVRLDIKNNVYVPGDGGACL